MSPQKSLLGHVSLSCPSARFKSQPAREKTFSAGYRSATLPSHQNMQTSAELLCQQVLPCRHKCRSYCRGMHPLRYH